MKHIKLFETSAAYNAAILDLPNVSLIEENMSVHYNPYVEPPFFCKLTLNDGSIVELEGSGKLPSNIIYNYRSTLVSAEIGEACTSVDNYAFQRCSSLTSVNIPDSVTSIGEGAFYSCSSLISIVIPSGVTSIGASTFESCSNLTSVVIGNSVTSIGNNAFYDCSGLTSVDIPDSVTSIGNWAFFICIGLTSVNIPDSVTSIGESAFTGCRVLTSITVEAITPPTLNKNVFNNTNDCPIYVPAESVEIYKVTEGWSNYVDRIQAIQ